MHIQHPGLAFNVYNKYQKRTSAQAKTLEQLSSGYRINRAGDDAAGLAVAEKLRVQLTGLDAALKNVKDGQSLVQVAEGALEELHGILNRMGELAEQSANGTYDNSLDRQQLQKELDELRTEIDRIAESANFNGIPLLDGSLAEPETLPAETDVPAVLRNTQKTRTVKEDGPQILSETADLPQPLSTAATGAPVMTAMARTAAVRSAAAAAPRARYGSFTVTGGVEDTDFTWDGLTLTVISDADITIAGGGGGNSIVVAANVSANITLAGVNIGKNSGQAALTIMASDSSDVNVNLNIVGENTLTGDVDYAGVEKMGGEGKLTIKGTGTLNAKTGAGSYGAGIGGSGSGGVVKNIEITGGVTVIAKGGEYAAGIGGGYCGSASNITISGGTVTATGGNDGGAGIGGGSGSGGSASGITISGGTVSATGGTGGAGIGGGYRSDGSGIEISGGTVTAKVAGSDGAGIGGGSGGNGSNITISGGSVNATGGNEGGAGIGGGGIGSGSSITITGGSVEAMGHGGGAGIGGGTLGEGSGIHITGCSDVTAGAVSADGDGGAGIGGGSGKDGSSITIDNSTVTATGGSGGAGIGGGSGGTGTGITITGASHITAEGGGGGSYGGAGIGGGDSKKGENITIRLENSGTVEATGSICSAGIGGSYGEDGVNIFLSGGTVTAKAGTGSNVEAIGHGEDGASFVIKDNVGTVTGNVTITQSMEIGADVKVDITTGSSITVSGSGVVLKNNGEIYTNGQKQNDVLKTENGGQIEAGKVFESSFPRSQVVFFDDEGNELGHADLDANKTLAQLIQTFISSLSRTGYTFKGWFDENDNEVDVDNTTAGTECTLYGKWEPITYNIAYSLNGGANGDGNPANYTIESDNITLTAPTRNGYTFTGWTWDGETTPQTSVTIAKGSTGDKTYTANWELISYNITYNLGDGATNSASNPAVYDVTKDAITLQDPSRTGYTFDGWYEGDDASTASKNVTIPKGSIGDKTFKAKWTPIEYNITYDLAGGTASGSNPDKYTVESNDFTLSNPTRTGYAFAGWLLDGESTASQSVTIPKGSTGEKKYMAQWTANSYTVTLNGNGGKISGNDTADKSVVFDADYGAVITDNTPVREGYTFNGWYTQADGGTKVESNSKLTTEGATLYAHWTANTYQVTLNANGGLYASGNPSPFNVSYDGTYGDNLSAANAPVREGYVFSGWNTKTDGTGDTITTNTTVKLTSGVTLYAIWTTNTYTIDYELNGGTNSASNPDSYKPDSGDITLAAPTRKGYTFTGWTYDGQDAPVANVTIPTGSTGHKKYTANWSANQYTVTLNGSGGTFSDGSNSTSGVVTYDQAYGAFGEPTKTGYTFSGWYTSESGGNKVDASTTVQTDADHSLYAHWTANTYKVTLDANGGVLSGASEVDVVYESSYSALGTPTREGYTFDGWWNGDVQVRDGDRMSTAGDHTLTAHWTKNEDPAPPDPPSPPTPPPPVVMPVVPTGNAAGVLTLNIGFSGEGKDQMEIHIESMFARDLGLKDGPRVSDISIATQAGASEAVAVIRRAVNQVSDNRGGLSAAFNRLESTAQALTVSSQNLSSAESVIRDADTAQELVVSTKNKIILQAAQAMMAQANQLPQGVLRLLG